MVYIKVYERPTSNVPGITSLYVSFTYNEQIKEDIKALPIHYWQQDTHEWEIPITCLSWLLNKYKDSCDITLNLLTEQEKPKEQVELPAVMPELVNTDLFSHQVDGVKHGYNNDSFILGDDQGLGKTMTIIDLAILRKMYNGLKHCLIICGVNDLKYVWANEIKARTNEKCRILGERKRKTKDKYYIGSMQDRIDDMLNPIDEFFIVTNVESFRDSSSKEKKEMRKKQKKGKKEYESVLVEAILNGPNKIDMVVIDEAHKIKNYTSGQGTNIIKLEEAKYKIPISGTILLNSPEDGYVPLRFIGQEKASWTSYKNFYCELGGHGGYQVIGYKNLDILREIMYKCMLRRKKSDVLDLPPKIYQTIYVEMGAKQEMLYNRVRDHILENADAIMFSEEMLGQLIQLRQATSCPSKLNHECTENAKLDKVEDLVEEILNEGGKVIIVSNWTSVTDVVQERLKRFNPVIYTGAVNSAQRDEIKHRFQTDPNCRVFIGTIATMGAGLTLTAAQTMIFMDSPWTKGDKEQCADRVHRIGTIGTVNIITLVCKDTIDERVEELVEKKGEITDYLIDGKIAKTERQELFNFLMDR